jgi:hypothetical protein
MVEHRDYMAVRGIVPRLLERNHAAGPALERIFTSYEALLAGGFIVVQRTPELDAALHAAATGAAPPAGRRRWRFGR